MLYHELSSLEHAGATFFDGSGMWDLRVSASAKSSFQSWMAKQTTELDGADVDELWSTDRARAQQLAAIRGRDD